MTAMTTTTLDAGGEDDVRPVRAVARRPGTVRAMQVTAGNVEDVRAWCAGRSRGHSDPETHARVAEVTPPGCSYGAYIGHWVIDHGDDPYWRGRANDRWQVLSGTEFTRKYLTVDDDWTGWTG